MRIRTRSSIKVGPGAGNLSLVRSIYDPDLRRCREVYLGKVKGDATPWEVPAIIDFAGGPDGKGFILTDKELEQLQLYLKPNEPSLLDVAHVLPKMMKATARALIERAKDLKRAGQGPDKELRSLVDAIRAAYEPDHKAGVPGFYGQLQRAGLIIVRGVAKSKKGSAMTEAPAAPAEQHIPTD